MPVLRRCCARATPISTETLPPGALQPASTGGHFLLTPAMRHAAGDWGDFDGEDKAANDADPSHAEGRLFSSYDTEDHGTIWVITEDLRGEGAGPTTTVLFPDEY